MNRPLEVRRGAVATIRERLSAVTGQSERTLMLGTILLVSAVSAATGYMLSQWFSVDVLSSLLFIPEDCWLDWGIQIGRHCFSDYALVVGTGLRPNPWAPYPLFMPEMNTGPLQIGGPAAEMVPHVLFGAPAKWLGVPQLGLLAYLLALTIAVLSPAFWASRGTRGLERVVVFVALGAAAVPAWAVIDRGNSAGFVVPIALVFLVALCRRRWGLVAVMVVLAALIKPQFAVLGVVLFAARLWRLGGLTVAGVVISNVAAYLLWPRDFPQTIAQSVHNLFHAVGSFQLLVTSRNVSFTKAILLIPDTLKFYQTGGKIPDGFLAGPRSLIGYVILVLVVVSVLALGRRITPVMAGIVLLATATLFPPEASYYYLVFALPIAALVVRDPGGPPGAGLFDRLATHGERRRTVGTWVSLAAALSIAQVALPSPVKAPILGQHGVTGVIGTRTVVPTTVGLTPILWLVACAVIIVAYARKPAHSPDTDQGPSRETSPDTAVGASSGASEPIAESSSQKQA